MQVLGRITASHHSFSGKAQDKTVYGFIYRLHTCTCTDSGTGTGTLTCSLGCMWQLSDAKSDYNKFKVVQASACQKSMNCFFNGIAQHVKSLHGQHLRAHLEVKLPVVEALVQNLQLHIRVHASS